MLGRLVAALRDETSRTAEHLLADDVRALTDGGGEFIAARVPVVGREKVARFYRKLDRVNGGGATARVTMLNGLPGLVIDVPRAPTGVARRFVAMVELDAAGRIRRIYNVLATRKLTAVR